MLMHLGIATLHIDNKLVPVLREKRKGHFWELAFNPKVVSGVIS